MRILSIAPQLSFDIVFLLIFSSSDLAVKCSLYPVKRYPDENSIKLFINISGKKKPPTGGFFHWG